MSSTSAIRRREIFLSRAPSSHMWLTTMIDAIVTDFETLRQHPASSFLADAAAAAAAAPTVEAKEHEFEVQLRTLEPMHYAPGFDPAMSPYNRNTTRALLLVAATYLALPMSVNSEAIEFGLRLCCFFFFTQPPERDLRTMEERQDDDGDLEDDDALVTDVRQQKNRGDNDADDDDDDDDDDDGDDDEAPVAADLVHRRPVPVDRRARVPITSECALYILSLCTSIAPTPPLSREAIRCFALLKAHDALALTPAVKYQDVALWCIVMQSVLNADEVERIHEFEKSEFDKQPPKKMKAPRGEPAQRPAMKRPLMSPTAADSLLQSAGCGGAAAGNGENRNVSLADRFAEYQEIKNSFDVVEPADDAAESAVGKRGAEGKPTPVAQQVAMAENHVPQNNKNVNDDDDDDDYPTDW